MVAVAALLALVCAATPTWAQDSRPEPTGLGIRLLEAPAHLVDDPRAHIYIIDNVPPGEVISRRVEVSNRTGRPADIEMYAAAASVADPGGFTPEVGTAANELTSWVSVDRPVIALADGGKSTVSVTIDVPADAPEGEQYAVLWAQVAAPEIAEGGTRTVSRIGVRIYLSVGPGNGPPADLEITTLTPRRVNGGAPEVVAAFANTGGRAVDVEGTVRLSEGPGQLSAGPFTARAATVAPTQFGEVVFTLPTELPNGPWQVDVTLTSGLVSRDATATVEFPDTGEGDPVPPDTGAGPGTWTVVGSLVVAVGAIAALVAVLARNRRSTRGRGQR